MAIRKEVEDFVAFCSPMPSEDDGTQFEIEECERLYNRIECPVSDEEALVLVTTFGDDDCFGLAWSVLHLIETAPGLDGYKFPNDSQNYWVDLMNQRVDVKAAMDKCGHSCECSSGDGEDGRSV